MNLDLTLRQAIVCGSTQGLGLASAKELALLGASVTLVARDAEKLDNVVKTLDTSHGQQHHYFVADFKFPSQVKQGIDEHLLKHPEVHILINNTGGPKGGTALDAAADDYLEAFNSHLICNQLLVQAVVPSMKSARFGRIINIISTSVKQPIADLGVSNTIRAAVANWAKTLAFELGPFGITVNNILPGFTDTARARALMDSVAAKTNKPVEQVFIEIVAGIPVGRIGQPEDIGAAVAFLCSPAASYINGINLPVDGGRLGTL